MSAFIPRCSPCSKISLKRVRDNISRIYCHSGIRSRVIPAVISEIACCLNVTGPHTPKALVLLQKPVPLYLDCFDVVDGAGENSGLTRLGRTRQIARISLWECRHSKAETFELRVQTFAIFTFDLVMRKAIVWAGFRRVASRVICGICLASIDPWSASFSLYSFW
jgi:hypothetical protein